MSVKLVLLNYFTFESLQVDGINNLFSELAGVVTQEIAMLDEYEALLATIKAMQVRNINEVILYILQCNLCYGITKRRMK